MKGILYQGEITFSHKERIEDIRRRNGHVLSSHAFPSLWLWRKQMGLRLYLEEELFSVKAEKYGKNTWFFPCGSEERKRAFIRSHQEEEEFVLCYLSEQDAGFLEENFPESFEIREDPDADEYIYRREEMEMMAGSRFTDMRHHINKIRKMYEVRTEKIGEGNLEDVRELLHKYSDQEHVSGCHLLRDDGVAEEGVRYWKELGLFGVLVYLNGEPEDFAMGFALTPDTVDGCIERHNGKISGISYLTQREFFHSAPAQYRFLNSEEDLGIPGLRMMKRHMDPVRKNLIWEARIKEEGKGKDNAREIRR